MDNFFINPARLDSLRHQVMQRGAAVSRMAPNAGESWDEFIERYGTEPRGYKVTGGTAVIPVRGALISCEIPYWYYFGDTSYEALAATIEHAMANTEVERVLLRINSPGGTVTGCAAAAARLDRAASGDKPLWAQCSMADSAAYWLASAANRIIVDPTGEVGSIGVIATHVDMSKMLEEWGVKITHIFSGKHKADGSPYAPLSERAQDRLQADMDQLRGLFVDGVAGYRQMDRDAVHKTEALTFIGASAVAEGLADDTGYFNDVLDTMAERTASGIAPSTAKQEESSKMAKKNLKDNKAPPPKASEEEEDKKEAAEDDAPEKDAEEDKDEPDADEEKDEGGSEAAKPGDTAAAERARIDAILNHKEASGRSSLANHLALKTSMSPADAAAVLAAAPKEAKDTPGNALADAMGKQGNPNLGAGVPAGGGDKSNAVLEDMRKRFAK